MQRPDRDPKLSCHVGAVQRLAGVCSDEFVEFPDQRQIMAQAQALGFGRRRCGSHRQIDRLQDRFFNALDHTRLNQGVGRMRREHQDIAQRRAKRLEFGRFRRNHLRMIEFARPAAIIDGIEVHEGDQIGLLLHDLTFRAAPDQQECRRAGLHAVQDQRSRIVHQQTDDRPGRGVLHLKNSRKCSLQIDRAGLQPQRGERCGEVPAIERNAACLAQTFDAPEMIEIRRPADLHEVRVN